MSFQASNCETNKTLFTSANTFLKGSSMIPRILSALVGLLMAFQTISWITNPGEAAQGLGMALLEGMGRSTQIGDFSSFFFSVTLFCFLGAYLKQAQWLISGTIILGSAAPFRSLAWIAHGADSQQTLSYLKSSWRSYSLRVPIYSTNRRMRLSKVPDQN